MVQLIVHEVYSIGSFLRITDYVEFVCVVVWLPVGLFFVFIANTKYWLVA
jgi:hypothetical protein